MKNIFYCVGLLGMLCTNTVNAQGLDSSLAVYSANYTNERCYLHCDKTGYAPGETVWFKAYLMEGFQPAKSSRTIYVDWIDGEGKLLHHTTAPVFSGGVSNGQFDIPTDYIGNVLHLRAYTRWMLNFDTAFLYRKTIRIIQPAEEGASTQAAIIPSLQFFPEGGDMVAGLRNKIAFKASDQWGRPVAIRGAIQKNGITIDSLKFLHNGMGFLYLFPEEGAVYAAKWIDAAGVEHTRALPTVKKRVSVSM